MSRALRTKKLSIYHHKRSQRANEAGHSGEYCPTSGYWLGACKMADFLSRNELQCRIERSLFDDCTLPEPRRVHAVLDTSGTSLVVNVFGDRV